MDCVIEKTLLQQTPLIHFQHDQHGATLRATEVKPKLDKFIKDRLGITCREGGNGKKQWFCGNEDCTDWFIPNTEALNYKLRFFPIGESVVSHAGDLAVALFNKEFDDKKKNCYNNAAMREYKNELTDANNGEFREQINEMFFANMVNKKEVKGKEQYKDTVRATFKETVFFRNGIRIQIVCFDKSLKQKIEELLGDFFILHHFGTRSSKGFGGFVVEGTTFDNCLNAINNSGQFFFYAETGSNDYKDLLNHAMAVYAVFKGGLNHTGWDEKMQRYRNKDRYIKSFIQAQYLSGISEKKGGKIGSDKVKIKRYIKPRTDKTPSEEEKAKEAEIKTYTDFIFSRALLGLADHIDFNQGVRKGKTVQIYSLGEDDFDVQRFQSPLTITVFDKYVFFTYDKASYNKYIAGKTFYFLDKDTEKYKPERKGQGEKEYYNKSVKNFIETNGVKIVTQQTLSEDDVKNMLSRFVKYFNSNEVKEHLKKFPRIYSNSATLVLKGGNLA